MLILEIDERILEKEKDVLKDILENVLVKRFDKKEWKDLFLENTDLENVPIKSDFKSGDNLFELK